MSYEAWRISYQSGEQAARGAYKLVADLERTLATTEKERDEWKDSALNGGNAGYLRQQLASTQLAAVKLREALGKYATAMDALYNHSDASREAVVLHFGIHHPDFSTPITKDAPAPAQDVVKALETLRRNLNTLAQKTPVTKGRQMLLDQVSGVGIAIAELKCALGIDPFASPPLQPTPSTPSAQPVIDAALGASPQGDFFYWLEAYCIGAIVTEQMLHDEFTKMLAAHQHEDSCRPAQPNDGKS